MKNVGSLLRLFVSLIVGPLIISNLAATSLHAKTLRTNEPGIAATGSAAIDGELLTIQGEAASKIYGKLDVPAIPAGEMGQDRIKMGKNIYCLAMYSTVVCQIKFSDLSQGLIQ